jgi:uncharacterized protein
MVAAIRLSLIAICLFMTAPSSAAPLVKLTNYVVDQAGVIPDAQERALIAKLSAHEAATSNQVAVATIRSLEGEVIEQAALEILRSTGLGQVDRNNGVLLLIAVEDRQMRIEVGYGLEGALPDGLAGTIIAREITPKFKAGDLAGGIEAGVNAILAAIKGEYTAPPANASDDDLRSWIPFAMFAAYFVIVVFLVRRKRQRRRARAAMGGIGGIGGTPYLGGWGGSDNDNWSGGGGFGGGGGGFGGGGGSGGGGGASGGW